jgi:hypothetical protein
MINLNRRTNKVSLNFEIGEIIRHTVTKRCQYTEMGYPRWILVSEDTNCRDYLLNRLEEKKGLELTDG